MVIFFLCRLHRNLNWFLSEMVVSVKQRSWNVTWRENLKRNTLQLWGWRCIPWTSTPTAVRSNSMSGTQPDRKWVVLKFHKSECKKMLPIDPSFFFSFRNIREYLNAPSLTLSSLNIWHLFSSVVFLYSVWIRNLVVFVMGTTSKDNAPLSCSM